MLKPQTLSDLSRAFQESPSGFVVADSGMPRFAVLPFDAYKTLTRTVKQRSTKGKVLVTGGAGYIGSVAVKILQKEGFDVVVYDNLSTGRREAVSDCRLVVGDLADRRALDNVFREEKIDAVMHFAASIEVEESVANPAKYYQNNLINGLNLLDVMRDNSVSKIVFSSSATVYGEPERLPIVENNACAPKNPYGETKFIFERILQHYSKAYGLRSVTLRYFNAAGAWPEAGLGYRTNDNSLLIPRVLNVACGRWPEIQVFGQDYPTPDGTCIRDYVHVLDLADAHILALKKMDSAEGAFVYNVGTGRGHSVLEVIDSAVEITGRMIPMNVAPRRPGDLSQSVADSTKLSKEFGWQAKHDLSSILSSSWAWHQKN